MNGKLNPASWWGPADGVERQLHHFVVWHKFGHAPIRTSEDAACGWKPWPELGLLESPEKLDPSRLCPKCLEVVGVMEKIPVETWDAVRASKVRM